MSISASAFRSIHLTTGRGPFLLPFALSQVESLGLFNGLVAVIQDQSAAIIPFEAPQVIVL